MVAPPPIDDVLGPGLRLLLVGINPGLRSSERNQHFAGPSNRFWPALHAAGLTPRRFTPADQHELLGLGIGITNLVPRPTAKASEVTRQELRDGARRLEALTAQWAPEVVAVLGVTAFRSAFMRPTAQLGRQEKALAAAELWVLPNPSGLNAATDPAGHARWLHAVGERAGLTIHDSV